MGNVKAMSIPFANTMCIVGEGYPTMVPLARDLSIKGKQLSVMQLHKGLKKVCPTYLAILRKKTEESVSDMPSMVIIIFG